MAFNWRFWTYGQSSALSKNRGLQTSDPNAYGANAASTVTVDSALQLSSVWACAKLITECVSTLPINVYKLDKVAKTRTIQPDHPIAKLFAGKVNRYQNRLEFFETLTLHLALLGNCYCLIQRNAVKEIIGLVPFDPSKMQVALLDDGGIAYQYLENSATKVYSQESVWHVKCMGNGLVGLSPLGYARNTLGIAQAAENSVSKIYSNGAKPSGVLCIDKTLNPAQRAQIKLNFKELEEGVADRLFVLEAGMTYQQVSMSPQDIQLLETRRFQLEDIARFFGVPSVLINDTSNSTVWGSGVQQIIQGFYKTGLRPYLERFELSILQSLCALEERSKLEIEFDINALLMPDEASRITSAKEAVTGGILTPNEGRARIGEGPVDGGDKVYMQQQMTPLSTLQNSTNSKPLQTPPASV